MSDENQEVTSQEQEAPQYSEVELAAMEHGWKPKEEYDGDPATWRDAQLFMTLKPFYEKIETQSKMLKQNQKNFQQIAKDMQLVKAQAYEKAMADLKAQRKEALHDGDIDRAELINEQIDNIKESHRQAAAAPQDVPQVNPEFEGWKSRNSWYVHDEDLRDWADARGLRLHGQGVAPDEVLQTLEKEVRKKFPEKFTNPNREKPGAVTQGAPSKRPAKADTSGMTQEEISIMRTIVRSGVMTEAEYLKQYHGSK